MGLEVFPGELGHHLALEIVDKAGPEDKFLAFRGLGVGGPGTDHDYAGIFADPGGGDGIARGVGTDNRQDIVLADELLCRGGGGFGLIFVILHEQFYGQLLVTHLEAAGLIHLGRQKFRGLLARSPTVGLLPVSSALTPRRVSFGILGAAAPGQGKTPSTQWPRSTWIGSMGHSFRC